MRKGVAILACTLLASMCSIVNAKEESPLFTFAVVSDIHIEKNNALHEKKFKYALQDLNQLSPKVEALIINGDLTEGQKDDYVHLKQILEESPHPDVYFTIGNHEFYRAWVNERGEWSPRTFPNGETEEMSLSRFKSWIKETKVYYERILQGIPFLFLGSEHYRQSNPNYKEDAFLSSEQLNWLKSNLDEAKQTKTNQPIFIFLHQPLPGTVSGTYDGFINQRAVIQHKQLRGILSHYSNIFFFSGHTHLKLNQPNSVYKGDITAINSSSIASPWENDLQGNEPNQDSEGLIIEVFHDHVMIKGRDFSNRRWIPEAQFTIGLEKPWYQPFVDLLK